MSMTRGLAIAVFLAAMRGIAAAADLSVPTPPPSTDTPAVPASDWIVTLGAEARLVPAWPGAPITEPMVTGLPLLGIRKAGTPPDFFGERDSFGFRAFDFGAFKFGPALKLIWQRNASAYPELNGLGNVNYALQAGGFAEFWAVPWLRLRGEVRQGFGGETGVTGDLFLDAIAPLGQFRFSAGPRMTLQTTPAVSPYFSISAAQAVASGLPAYSATGGFYSYGAGGKVEYFWSPQWETHGFVEYERLTDSAADSPLVTERGSPNQFTFGVGATYSFAMKPLW